MDTLNFLVVEDSPTMRQLISFALRRFSDCRILEAVDGADALRKMAYEKVDVILTDINMPIMDGLKLVSVVRSTPATRRIPVIIITTEGAEEDKKRGLALGADAYVSKPIEADDLVRTVTEVLEGRRLAAPTLP
jgi:two-component system chemotaxis response regulator CheY